jgi:hypothetical protein
MTYADNEAFGPYSSDSSGRSACITTGPFHGALRRLEGGVRPRSGGFHEHGAELRGGRSGVDASRE